MFDPFQLSREEFMYLAGKSRDIASRISETVRQTVLQKGQCHFLLTGPRGIGKTHLLRLVQELLLQDSSLHGKIVFSRIPEDNPGIVNLGDIVPAILRGIVTDRPDPGSSTPIKDFLAQRPGQEQANIEFLEKYLKGRKCVVSIENLDSVIGTLNRKAQAKLRQLCNSGHFCIVGSAVTAQRLHHPRSPFYRFFAVERVPELSFDAAVALVAKIANLTRNVDLQNSVQTPVGRARMRAIHYLTGGTPRTLIACLPLILRRPNVELYDLGRTTIEFLSNYYRSEIQLLTPPQVRVVEAFCETEGPRTVTDVATAVQKSSTVVDRTVRELEALRWVRRQESDGQVAEFELREPLARWAYQLKASPGELDAEALRFLLMWHSRESLGPIIRRLPLPTLGLPLSTVLKALENKVRTAASRGSLDAFKDSCDARDYPRAVRAAIELVDTRGLSEDYVALGHAYCFLQEYQKALTAANEAITRDPRNALAWLLRGELLAITTPIHGPQGQIALLAGGAPIPQILPNCGMIGWGNLGLTEIADFPPDPRPFLGYAELLLAFGHYREALLYADLAVRQGLRAATVAQVEALAGLGQFGRAFKLLKKAVKHQKVFWPDLTGIVQLLLKGPDGRRGAARVRQITRLFVGCSQECFLAAALGRSIRALRDVSSTRRDEWVASWKKAARDHEEFSVVLNMLEVAVEVIKTGKWQLLRKITPVQAQLATKDLLQGHGNSHPEIPGDSNQPGITP
jgi:tetratricopeptide (TPR) repeat protein